MCGNDGFVNVGNMVHQIIDFCSVFIGKTITGCIRDIDHRSAGLDHSFDNTGQIFRFRSPCIFCVKFHIVYELPGVFNGIDGTADDFFRCGVQFFMDVVYGSANAGMDTSFFGILQCFGCHFDIFFYSTGESTDGRVCDRLGDFHDRVKIAGTRNRKAGFDDIDPEFFQLTCHFDFLNGV